MFRVSIWRECRTLRIAEQYSKVGSQRPEMDLVGLVSEKYWNAFYTPTPIPEIYHDRRANEMRVMVL